MDLDDKRNSPGWPSFRQASDAYNLDASGPRRYVSTARAGTFRRDFNPPAAYRYRPIPIMQRRGMVQQRRGMVAANRRFKFNRSRVKFRHGFTWRLKWFKVRLSKPFNNRYVSSTRFRKPRRLHF